MIKRKGSYKKEAIEKMRGGEGFCTIEHLLTPEELYEKGRLYAHITLEPGHSIGYHVHENEMESYYVVSGEAEYMDNAEKVHLYPGDTTFTPAGEGHSVKCVSNEPLTIIAQILFK